MLERALPLVEQVRQRLLRGIRDNSLVAANDALPSEAEISERLAVSRATVRDALAQLERDHVIIRRHGSGTSVNPTIKALTAPFDILRDPATLIEMTGQTATTADFSARLDRLSARAAQALALAAGGPAVAVEVTYLANGRPAIWLAGTIPVSAPPPALPRDYTALTQLAADLTGHLATHSLATLEPVVAVSHLARRLKIRTGQAVLRLLDVYLPRSGTPAFYSESAFAPGVIPLQLLRKTDSLPQRGPVSIW